MLPASSARVGVKPPLSCSGPKFSSRVIHADLIAGGRRHGEGHGVGAETADDVVSEAGVEAVDVRQIDAGVAGDDGVLQRGHAGAANAAAQIAEARSVAGDRAALEQRGAALDDDGAGVMRGGVAADRAVGHVQDAAAGDGAAVAVRTGAAGDGDVVQVERRRRGHGDSAAASVAVPVAQVKVLERDGHAGTDIEDAVEIRTVDGGAGAVALNDQVIGDVEIAGECGVFVGTGQRERDRHPGRNGDRVDPSVPPWHCGWVAALVLALMTALRSVQWLMVGAPSRLSCGPSTLMRPPAARWCKERA